MKLKAAIVGTGGIAGMHGISIAGNPDVELVGSIDVDREKREVFAERWGGSAYATLSECLDKVDVVYVLTPPGCRRQFAVEALEAGKHVFCEKPLAITVADGEAIADAAEKKKLVAMTGFNQRYRKGYTRLHDVTASGALGKPYHFWCQRFGMGAGARGEIAIHNWRTDQSSLCGMTVESLSHDIDLMRWIMDDEVSTVAGITSSTAKNLKGFDNNSHVLMKLKSGASAVIDASWSSRVGFNTRGVLGEKGSAFVSGTDIGNNGIWCSRQFHVKTDDDEFENIEMLQDNLDEKSYKNETDDFINSILTGGKPLVSVRDGYETLRVSHAILESSKNCSIVELR